VSDKPPVAPPPSLPEAGDEKRDSTLSISLVCPRCGSDDLASGYLVDYGEKFQNVFLAPRLLRLRKLRNMLRPFRNLVKVDADVCRRCGMVILEVNTDDFADAEERFGRR